MNPRIRNVIAAIGLGALLAGCAGHPAGTPGYFSDGSATMRDVAARMGSPSSVWFDDQGRENWDYSGNQASFFGYRATFDEAGRVVQWRQLRTERDVAGLVPGRSTARDVHAALGEPNEMFFVRGEPHWRWRVYYNIRPHFLVAHMSPDGMLKGVIRISIDGGARAR